MNKLSSLGPAVSVGTTRADERTRRLDTAFEPELGSNNRAVSDQ